jgi:hypothetical protein
MTAEGKLKKMHTLWDRTIQYHLELSVPILMNDLLEKNIRLEWDGRIICVHCEKLTKKSFGDGFCYSCFVTAPQASECTIRPELCQAHLGKGRDPEWEERNHNTSHVVYLAATDTVKVGVTRATQVPTRWIDQGASAAIRIAETPNRFEAGRLEVALKDFFTDKTNWQKMLKNEINDSIDLVEEKWSLHEQLPQDLLTFFSENDEVIEMNYPVVSFPTTLQSISLDKSPIVEGQLLGIKGQYLLFDGGRVFNVRKHTGYAVITNY